MTAIELRDWIASMTQDIDFSYKGITGSICPFSDDDIALAYGNSTFGAHSIDEAMNAPFINGKSLNDLAEQLEI